MKAQSKRIIIEGTINSENQRLLDKYEQYINIKNLSPKTINNYLLDLQQWMKFMNSKQGDLLAKEATEDDIEEYMRAISTLSRIIELISEVKLPDELSGIAIRYLPYSVKSVAGVSVGKKLTGVVDEISAVEYDERGRYYTICLLLEEDTGRSRGIEHKIQLIVR